MKYFFLTILFLLPLSSGAGESYYLKALKAQKSGQLYKAAKLYSKELKKHPRHLQSHLNLATVYHYLKDPAKAHLIMKDVLEIYPFSLEANFNMGIIFAKEKRWKKASKFFEYAVKIRKTDFKSQYQLSKAYRKVKSFQVAEKQNLLVIGMKPKDISIRFEHAHFLIKNLQYQLAEKEFWKMLELDKKNHLINFEYALLLDKMKNRADNAITQYNNVILVKPENRIARYNLARNYERVKLWKEAKQHYQIVLVKDPRHYPANIRLGIIARKENKDQLAFKHFDKAIAANPKVILPYEEKALILTKQEKYDLAAAQYELLIGQHKNYARAYVFKGWLFEKLGELKNAEGQYKKAVRLDKDSDYSARNLKEFYLRKKKKK